MPVINLGDFEGKVHISSPGFPGLYPSNSDCHWSLVTSDPTLVIEVEVITWMVNKKCLMKWLYIFHKVI